MVRTFCAVLWCCTACAAPTIRVETEPATSSFYLDAKAAGAGLVERDIPYYGVVSLTAVPNAPHDQRLREARGRLEIREPWSPWLFPFDFFLEVGSAALGQLPTEYEMQLDPIPREVVPVEGIRPPRLEELRLRAQSMAAER